MSASTSSLPIHIPKPEIEASSRKRKIKDPFEHRVRVIHERFFDHRPGDLVADIDRHRVVADCQRDRPSVDLGDQRADRFAWHGPFETLEPRRFVTEHRQFVVFDAEDVRSLRLLRLHGELFIAWADEFEGVPLADGGFQLTRMDANLRGADDFHQRPRPEDQLRLLDEFDHCGVRPAIVGANPVSRPQERLAAHSRPPFVHHRLDRREPLHFGNAADAAIFRERVADD